VLSHPYRCYMPTLTTSLMLTVTEPALPNRDGACVLAPALHHGPLQPPRAGVAIDLGII
jgi:hypothetical protein